MTVVTMLLPDGSLGVTFPPETCERMGLKAGQRFTLIELANSIKLMKYSAELERQLELARKVLHEQADVLRELANADRAPAPGRLPS